MPDETDNLVLKHLRQIRAEIGRHGTRMDEVLNRLSRLEVASAGIRAEIAGTGHEYAIIQTRIDRLSKDVERIMRRLDLADAGA